MPGTVIRRAVPDDLHALHALLCVYYSEQNISVRDALVTLERELAAPELGFFLAVDEQSHLLGCALVHPLPSVGPGTAECKRLFVCAEARGHGLANQLLERLEATAGAAGYEWMYLDSLDRFTAALRLYARRNFQPCDPYPGSDPQATRFFRKRLR